MRSGPNRSKGASISGGSHNRPLVRRLLQFPADWPAEFRHRSAVPPPAFLENLRPQQPPPDHLRQLLAPEGWLELGNWNEANEELEKFTLGKWGISDVLGKRFRIYAAAGGWQLPPLFSLIPMERPETFAFHGWWVERKREIF